MWLIGFGIYDIPNLANLPSPPKFSICLSEGQIAEEKVINYFNFYIT